MFRLLFATLEPKILPNTVVILAAKKRGQGTFSNAR
jgi:hypothetical protein